MKTLAIALVVLAGSSMAQVPKTSPGISVGGLRLSARGVELIVSEETGGRA